MGERVADNADEAQMDVNIKKSLEFLRGKFEG